MSELSIQELEKTAAAYEELLVPAVLQAWTSRVADAAEPLVGQHVLDVACGTGVLARTVAARVGPSGSVVGLDINPGMLAVAARIAPEIEWRQGSAESLPFEDQSFDAVVCQFALMLFPNRQTALGEMVRVLRSGGRLAVVVFDSLDNNPAYKAVASVYQQVVNKDTVDALRSPFSLGDTKELSALCATVGIPSASIISQKGAARFSSVRDMILADVKGWFPLAQINLDEHTIEAVVTEAETALEPFLLSDGAVEFQVSAHLVTA